MVDKVTSNIASQLWTSYEGFSDQLAAVPNDDFHANLEAHAALIRDELLQVVTDKIISGQVSLWTIGNGVETPLFGAPVQDGNLAVYVTTVRTSDLSLFFHNTSGNRQTDNAQLNLQYLLEAGPQVIALTNKDFLFSRMLSGEITAPSLGYLNDWSNERITIKDSTQEEFDRLVRREERIRSGIIEMSHLNSGFSFLFPIHYQGKPLYVFAFEGFKPTGDLELPSSLREITEYSIHLRKEFLTMVKPVMASVVPRDYIEQWIEQRRPTGLIPADFQLTSAAILDIAYQICSEELYNSISNPLYSKLEDKARTEMGRNLISGIPELNDSEIKDLADFFAQLKHPITEEMVNDLMPLQSAVGAIVKAYSARVRDYTHHQKEIKLAAEMADQTKEFAIQHEQASSLEAQVGFVRSIVHDENTHYSSMGLAIGNLKRHISLGDYNPETNSVDRGHSPSAYSQRIMDQLRQIFGNEAQADKFYTYLVKNFTTNLQIPLRAEAKTIERRLRLILPEKYPALVSVGQDFSRVGFDESSIDSFVNEYGIQRAGALISIVDEVSSLYTQLSAFERAHATGYNTILSIGRLSKKESISLNESLYTTLTALRNDLDIHNVVVDDSQLAPQIPLLTIDNVRVVRVFENIIKNAYQHGAKNVYLSTAERDYQGAHYLSVVIANDGQPISEEYKPHLFEEGFTTSALSENTGRGLSFVEKTMNSFGGHVILPETQYAVAFELLFPIK